MTTIKYGLTLPSKKTTSSTTSATSTATPRLAAFDDDDDDDDTPVGGGGGGSGKQQQQHGRQTVKSGTHNDRASVNKMIMKEATLTTTSHAVRKEMKKAMEDDPSVFAYDEVYDSMKDARANTLATALGSQGEQKDNKQKSKPAPRYIHALMKTAVERKHDFDLVQERLAHREREEEEGAFEDKDKFVTSAYKKQLLEMREFEKQQKLKDEADNKKDMGSFYRNLLLNDLAKDTTTSKPAPPTASTTTTTSTAAAATTTAPMPPPAASRTNQPKRQHDSLSPEPEPEHEPTHTDTNTAPSSQAQPLPPPQPPQRPTQPPSQQPDATVKMARATTDDAVNAARARYLARKKNVAAPVVDDD